MRTSSSYYSGDEDFGDEKSAPGDGNKGADDDEYGLMDAVADMVRSYFSVDVVKDEDGNEEMVVMASPRVSAFSSSPSSSLVQTGSIPRGHLPGDARRPAVAMSVTSPDSSLSNLGFKCFY